MRKQVIVHAGFPKTASSALQLFFSQNVGRLRAAGVAYPSPDRASVIRGGGGTGNLVHILAHDGFIGRFEDRHREREVRVSTVRVVDRAYWERVEELVREGYENRVLLSGEFVGNQTADQLAFMRETLVARHDVHVIGFVRDPFDFAWSAWKQQVKTNVQRRSFAERIAMIRYGERRLNMFSCFDAVNGLGCRVSIVNYDTFRKNLLATFLKTAGISIDFPSSTLHADNRSLTDSEAEVLHAVNVRFNGTPLPKALARGMLQRDAAPDGSRYYSRAVHRAILEAEPETLHQLNEVIIGDPLKTTLRDAPDVPVEIDVRDVELLARMSAYETRRREPRRLARAIRRMKRQII